MDSTAAQSIISFKDVSFAYEQGRLVLNGLTLSVAEGEFVAVIGANGSGKSTLARHINALLQPSSGSVQVCGLDAADASAAFDIRRQAAMVFQNPDNQAVASCVEDDVAFGPENLGVEPAEIRERVDASLEVVGMLDHATAQIHTLSGGQKQRVAIAGALALHPRILILDEPTSMLDVAGRRAVLKIAHQLNEQGMTVVLITHFMDEAAQAGRIVVLDKGAVVLDGAPQEIFDRAQELRDLGLDLPFEVELKRRLEKDAPPESAAPSQQGAVGDFSGATLSDVSFSYDEHPALQGVNLAIAPGEFWGVVGSTGSGKSTLLQLLNALLVPATGVVSIDGMDTAEKQLRTKIRSQVGMAFQYPERQLFANTVAEDVAFGPTNLGLGADEVAQRVAEALAQMNLDVSEIGEKSPFELSGGQQRRVALAGILAMKPAVLALDEPAAGMDPQSRRQLNSLLAGLNVQGMTIVLVSHSMDDVAQLCNKLVVLDKGNAILQGTPHQVFTSENAPLLEGIGLGLPQPTVYAEKLKEAGEWGAEQLPLTLDELVKALREAR